MQELYDKLKHYTISDAIKIEELDRQYIALEKLYENMKIGHPQGVPLQYLSLILSNSIICYQLS
ncbi:N-glycosylase/DNA lyase [Patescibacteria group bacterium]